MARQSIHLGLYWPVIALAGCVPVVAPDGSSNPAPVPQSPAPVTPTAPVIAVPIVVPVAVNWPTNLDIIRSSCPGLTDGEIIDLIIAFDDAWWDGWTYSEQIDENTVDCQEQEAVPFSVCTYCYDTVVDFIYLIVH